jgi:hypothetical protein
VILLLLSVGGLIAAAIPAITFLANWAVFRDPRELVRQRRGEVMYTDSTSKTPPRVSVLIPARDEADGIRASLDSILASRGVELEVVVLDDHSTDDTASIVAELGRADDRVRCVAGRALPAGWNGKQFACYQLAEAATHDTLVFLDADVRLRPDGLATLEAYREGTGTALLSTFPRQRAETWLEAWLIPMMHTILLGFLPIRRMRESRHPAYAAGCGQLFMTDRAAYRQAGTHEAIRRSRHDGVKLPRAYREAGLSTDVVDGTELAECRMYHSTAEVIRGLLKNATEGIANAKLIVPFTVVLLGGAVLPWVTLVWGLMTDATTSTAISVVAIVLSYLPRAASAWRFRQPFSGAVCHPAATTVFVALQWVALANQLTGRQVAWRGRVETNGHASTSA